jgi:hypothetical protein
MLPAAVDTLSIFSFWKSCCWKYLDLSLRNLDSGICLMSNSILNIDILLVYLGTSCLPGGIACYSPRSPPARTAGKWRPEQSQPVWAGSRSSLLCSAGFCRYSSLPIRLLSEWEVLLRILSGIVLSICLFRLFLFRLRFSLLSRNSRFLLLPLYFCPGFSLVLHFLIMIFLELVNTL